MKNDNLLAALIHRVDIATELLGAVKHRLVEIEGQESEIRVLKQRVASLLHVERKLNWIVGKLQDSLDETYLKADLDGRIYLLIQKANECAAMERQIEYLRAELQKQKKHTTDIIEERVAPVPLESIKTQNGNPR